MKKNFENLTAFIESLDTVIDKYNNNPESMTNDEVDFANIWQIEMAKAIIKDIDVEESYRVAKIISAFAEPITEKSNNTEDTTNGENNS